VAVEVLVAHVGAAGVEEAEGAAEVPDAVADFVLFQEFEGVAQPGEGDGNALLSPRALPDRHFDVGAELDHEQLEGEGVVADVALDAFEGEVAGEQGLHGAGELLPGKRAGLPHAALRQPGQAGELGEGVLSRVLGKQAEDFLARRLSRPPAVVHE